ncbi:hypothetical protein AG1IA_08585 [Rhizoctonia solani AG-1 IA]|uniref:Uncharacterized protein n=1 Tax=Thanatephorus cucumeris (strain AG1-IA) TaxID=983506 RepID=L8WHH9_THACA|nr:hypothetical protein AG1IA_08585 [Rhizoctonia solani AG-1 IA]
MVQAEGQIWRLLAELRIQLRPFEPLPPLSSMLPAVSCVPRGPFASSIIPRLPPRRMQAQLVEAQVQQERVPEPVYYGTLGVAAEHLSLQGPWEQEEQVQPLEEQVPDSQAWVRLLSLLLTSPCASPLVLRPPFQQPWPFLRPPFVPLPVSLQRRSGRTVPWTLHSRPHPIASSWPESWLVSQLSDAPHVLREFRRVEWA